MRDTFFFLILIINEKERSHEPCSLAALVSTCVKTNSLGDVTRRRYLYRVVALQRYSQSRRTACRRTERGLEVVLYGGSPLTFFRSAGNGR